jgi:chromosome segregation ATPase
MTRKIPKMERFDLSLPPVAVDLIRREAEIRCVHPRTMGRILIVEKLKEITGITPDQRLTTVTGAIPAATREGATHGNGD